MVTQRQVGQQYTEVTDPKTGTKYWAPVGQEHKPATWIAPHKPTPKPAVPEKKIEERYYSPEELHQMGLSKEREDLARKVPEGSTNIRYRVKGDKLIVEYTAPEPEPTVIDTGKEKISYIKERVKEMRGWIPPLHIPRDEPTGIGTRTARLEEISPITLWQTLPTKKERVFVEELGKVKEVDVKQVHPLLPKVYPKEIKAPTFGLGITEKVAEATGYVPEAPAILEVLPETLERKPQHQIFAEQFATIAKGLPAAFAVGAVSALETPVQFALRPVETVQALPESLGRSVYRYTHLETLPYASAEALGGLATYWAIGKGAGLAWRKIKGPDVYRPTVTKTETLIKARVPKDKLFKTYYKGVSTVTEPKAGFVVKGIATPQETKGIFAGKVEVPKFKIAGIGIGKKKVPVYGWTYATTVEGKAIGLTDIISPEQMRVDQYAVISATRRIGEPIVKELGEELLLTRQEYASAGLSLGKDYISPFKGKAVVELIRKPLVTGTAAGGGARAITDLTFGEPGPILKGPPSRFGLPVMETGALVRMVYAHPTTTKQVQDIGKLSLSMTGQLQKQFSTQVQKQTLGLAQPQKQFQFTGMREMIGLQQAQQQTIGMQSLQKQMQQQFQIQKQMTKQMQQLAQPVITPTTTITFPKFFPSFEIFPRRRRRKRGKRKKVTRRYRYVPSLVGMMRPPIAFVPKYLSGLEARPRVKRKKKRKKRKRKK